MRRARTLLLAFTVVLAACGGGGGGNVAGSSASSAPVAAQDFSVPGPYAVGVTRLQLDAARPVVVFYPADQPPAGATPFVYTTQDTFGPLAAALPPGVIADTLIEGAWVDIPASTNGPFPVLVFTHGRGATPFSYTRHYAHVASWGFVVAAPDHPTRDLVARLGGRDSGASDVTTILDTHELLLSENARAGGTLEGRIAPDQFAVEGHSAGGRDAALAAYDPSVDAWISLAGAVPVPDEATGGRDVVTDGNDGFDPATGEFDLDAYLAHATPPSKPSLVIASGNDFIYPLADRQAVYEWLPAPKRFAVLSATGHSVFFDPCASTQVKGGMQDVAAALGLDESSIEIQLVEDGCLPGDAPVSDVVAVWNHLAVAQLRWAFDIDRAAAAASLDPTAVGAMFPGRLETYVANDGGVA